VQVLDEPTASLPANEVERLFAVRVAVLRDGRLVGASAVAATNPEELVEMIIGRRTASRHWRGVVASGAVRLVVEGLVTEEAGPADFAVAAGECVAMVGLRGAGQVAIGRALFGAAERLAGRVLLDGHEPDLATPRSAMAGGITFVSGERVEEMKVSVIKSVGKANHHQTPATIALCWLAQKIMVPTVGVFMSVKPRTESVTSRPIDRLMLFNVVEKTIGST
jgi:ABC-type sugar transport system ATPase subunit